MKIRRVGGMMEFIPTPKEKRESLLHDYGLLLLENLHERLQLIERTLGLPQGQAQEFSILLARLSAEERRNLALNDELLDLP